MQSLTEGSIEQCQFPLDLSERWCTTWFSFRKYNIYSIHQDLPDDVTCGIKLFADVLGPLLFSIFVNDLSSSLYSR